MAAWRRLVSFGVRLLCVVSAAVLGENCQAYTSYYGSIQPAISCPHFCCGYCMLRFCCSTPLLKLDERLCSLHPHNERASDSSSISDTQFSSDPDDDIYYGPSLGTFIAIGVIVCAVIVITIILCLTCSCCCLYKACRRPRPVVTTTTSTTVVHAPYPQQQGVTPNYPVAPYQGYQPVAIQPQPGVPVAPYPAQYPPPYPMQPSGPPAYHETMAAGVGAPYGVSQPPYNPAYMDPQKPTY